MMKSKEIPVPEQKKIRLIVHTDCKNEADDQYAVVHELMTPRFDIKGFIAGHFERGFHFGEAGTSVDASYDEINRILNIMGLENEYSVYRGAAFPMDIPQRNGLSEGAEFLIREAMREEERPLYAVFQGAITDLADAYRAEPKIAKRLTAVWVGGGKWPEGGFEFNLMQDIKAANEVFASDIPLWVIPINVYKQLAVSLAELKLKVEPCGAIGKYLYEQLIAFNLSRGDMPGWPPGESWGLGDSSVISVLLEEQERMNWEMVEAPSVNPDDMTYIHGTGYRPIRIYHQLDTRFTLEDFFSKLKLNMREGTDE